MNKLFFSDSIFLRTFLLVPDKKHNDVNTSKSDQTVTTNSKTPTICKDKQSKRDISTPTKSIANNETASVQDFLKNLDSKITASKQVTLDITKKDIRLVKNYTKPIFYCGCMLVKDFCNDNAFHFWCLQMWHL